MSLPFSLNKIILDANSIPCDYIFLEINTAFEQLIDLKRDDIIGKSHNGIFPGDDPEIIKLYGELALSGKSAKINYYSATLKKHYEIYSYSPEPLHFALLFNDVTEYKKKEQLLNKLNKTYKAMSDSNQEMMRSNCEQDYLQKICNIIVDDCDYKRVWIGFAVHDKKKSIIPMAQVGFDTEYIKVLNISWADNERGWETTGIAIRTGEPAICKNMSTDPHFSIWKEEATKRGYASSISLPMTIEGKPFAAITIYSKEADAFSEDEIKILSELASDLSYGILSFRFKKDKAEAEKLLEIQAEILNEQAQMLDHGHIFVKDKHDIITFWNQGAEKLYGYTKNEAIGKNAHYLLKTKTNFSFEDINLQLLKTGKWEGELIHTKSDGSLVAVASHWIQFRDKDNNEKAVLEVNNDITQLKKIELALIEAEKKLKIDNEGLEQLVIDRSRELYNAQIELERSKRLSDIGTLASTVAHELRNPLAAINISSALIKRKTDDASIKKHLKNIEKCISESDQIINNLLFYSRLRAPHRETIEIQSIIKECVGNIQKQSKKIISFVLGTDLNNQIFIDADPLQMKEVFYNILNNSYDSISDKDGKIEIEFKEDKNYHLISIIDNGMGIDSEDLKKVFDPFFSTKAKGTGLGLSVCQKIILLHNGSINIESEKHNGTKIYISLPKKLRTETPLANE